MSSISKVSPHASLNDLVRATSSFSLNGGITADHISLLGRFGFGPDEITQACARANAGGQSFNDYLIENASMFDLTEEEVKDAVEGSLERLFVTANIRKYAPNLPLDEVFRVMDYIETNENALFLQASSDKGGGCYVIPKESGLARAILYTNEHKVFIHLNRKKEGDVLLGKGTTKVATVAVELLTGKAYASPSMVEEKEGEEASQRNKARAIAQEFIELDVDNTLTFKGDDDFVQIHALAHYTTKDGEQKIRMVVDLGDDGDLQAVTPMTNIVSKDPHPLSPKEQQAVFDSIVRIVQKLHHKYKGLHRDLKSPQFLVMADHESRVQGVKLTDFGSVLFWNDIEDADVDSRGNHSTTSWVASPEYAKARLIYTPKQDADLKAIFDDPDKTKEQRMEAAQISQDLLRKQIYATAAATNGALDIWSAGAVLYPVLGLDRENGPLPWVVGDTDEDAFAVLANLKDGWFPEPADKDSLKHRVWQMLRINSLERSLEDVWYGNVRRLDLD